MHGGQRGRRVHAERGGERLAGVLEHAERVGLTARRVQRAHELAAQPLPQRMLGGQLLDLGNELGATAECQVGVDPVLGRGQPQLGEPGDRARGERRVGHVGQGRSAPQPQRITEQVGRGGLVSGGTAAPGQPGPRRGGEPLERPRVDLLGREGQPVPRRAVRDEVLAGRAPQPGHERLNGVRRIGRAVDRPQVGREAVDGHGMPVADGQPDQHAAQPGAADRQRPSGCVPHFQRAEYADADAHVPGCHDGEAAPRAPPGSSP
jgi:hypothetical protein